MARENFRRELDWNLIAIALIALSIGIALYLIDRPASHIYFIPASLVHHHRDGGLLFGTFGYYLPTFVHVFAFCLLTAGIIGKNRKYALFICLFWLFIDGIFEIAQYPAIARLIADYIPAWFDGIPFLENTKNYFLQGRFDVWDMASIITGAVLAYLLILLFNTKTQKPVENITY